MRRPPLCSTKSTSPPDLLLLTPALGHANSAALTGHPSPAGGGGLQVDKDNGLKIRKESVSFDIQEDRLEARVTVAYQVENTRDAPYDGALLFIVPDAAFAPRVQEGGWPIPQRGW